MAAAGRWRLRGGSLFLSVVLAFALVTGGVGHGGNHAPPKLAHGLGLGSAPLANAHAAHLAANFAAHPAAEFRDCQNTAGLDQCTGLNVCPFCAPAAEVWQPQRATEARAARGFDALGAALEAPPPTPPPEDLS